MTTNREHWEHIYRTRADENLSWFQRSTARSLELIDTLRVAPKRIIDIGGGQSAFAGELLDRLPESAITVLDIAPAAIERAQKRLGERAARIHWVAADVLDPPPLDPVDLWHDRAVFHFLTAAEDRTKYLDLAVRTVVPGGHLLIATFALTGPERCSGLPVVRYDTAALALAFRPRFNLISACEETHTTPWGALQPFTIALLRRV